jgi:hypothetical protein
MSDPASPSIFERSSIVRFFRWLFSWRVLRRCLIAVAWVVTIIALLYGEENWRGRRAWNKFRREAEARGEQIEWKASIPQPVPEEQNFAATPVIQSWFPRGQNGPWTDEFTRVVGKVRTKSKGDKNNRHFIDLAAWAAAFTAEEAGETNKNQQFEIEDRDSKERAKAAPAVLQGLKSSDAVLEELREASRRPYARYPVVYNLDDPWGILLPHLAKIKGAGQRLQTKACAELAAGQSDKALEDVKLLLYLADSLREEPFLISYLVRIACVQQALQPIWEGLAEHHWSDAQLQELQNRLQKYDLVADVQRPLHGERNAGILTIDLLYRQKYRLKDLWDSLDVPQDIKFLNVLGRIAPHGWYYQEQRNYFRLFDLQFAGTLDLSKKRVFPAQVQRNNDELQRLMASGRVGKTPNALLHHQVMAGVLLPQLEGIPWKAAFAQTTVEEAMLACALERFRLANGKFPEELAALVPRFISQLPNDVLTGEPFKYSRENEKQFILYSVGWNLKDDGGIPGATLNDNRHGDWVWQYPR